MIKERRCDGCKPCLNGCCCTQMRPYPKPDPYADGIHGTNNPFMGYGSADCCGVLELKYVPIYWNWGGAGFTITNPASYCPSPTETNVPIGTAPACLSAFLAAHGGFDEVTVGVDACGDEYSGLAINDYVLIPRDRLTMVPLVPPEYCGDVELLQIADGSFACVTVKATDGATIQCTTCFIGQDVCVPCSSSGSSGGSSGSGTSSGSGGSSGSGSGSGSGGGDGSGSSSGSSGSGSGSSSGSGSGSGGGGDGGGSSSGGGSTSS